MPATVLVKELVEALERQFAESDESSSFLDLDTGVIETVSRGLLRDAEESRGDEPDLPGWQREEWEIARRIVSTDRFERLPAKRDIHEWDIMQDFALSVASARIREDLLDAIHGSGAFRMFRSAIRRHRIESEWSRFRAEALKQIAVEWCQENHLDWQ